MDNEEQLKLTILIKSNDSFKYKDIQARILIRQVIITMTEDEDQFNIDDAIQVLKGEVLYLEGRVKDATISTRK